MGFAHHENLDVVQGIAWPSVADVGVWEWRAGEEEDEDPETGLPPAVDLTGYTAVLKVRASREPDAVALVSLTDASGITLGGAAGTIAVEFSEVQTAALPVGVCIYDMVLYQPSGAPVPFLSGEVRVVPWMSRA